MNAMKVAVALGRKRDLKAAKSVLNALTGEATQTNSSKGCWYKVAQQ